jgi:hypothetical protein
MPGTTVAQKLNQGSPRPLGGIKRPAPFLGTFLGEQKGTKTKTKFIETLKIINCNSTIRYILVSIDQPAAEIGIKGSICNGGACISIV